MTIKAVVFDAGGVLEIVDDATWPRQWRERWMGIGRDVVEPGVGTWSPTMSEAATRSYYAALFGLDSRQADAMMADLWDCYCGRLDVELRDYLARRRPTHRTAILTNSGAGAREQEQQRFGLGDLVDTIVYSHEVGVAKPDRQIFELTAERLGVDADEVVFLDDTQACVDGARAAGWHAIRHVDTRASIDALNELLAR